MKIPANERPIIMNAESIRAILAGRKSQTRRVVKSQPPEDCGAIAVDTYHPAKFDKHGEMYPGDPIFGAYDECGEWGVKSPYGQPGDQLWIRETWGVNRQFDVLSPRFIEIAMNGDTKGCIDYRATPLGDAWRGRWRPSIHMPRWASRITLEVISVRAERLRVISEADAQWEGWDWSNHDLMDTYDPVTMDTARRWFAQRWDAIYGNKPGHAWDGSPWVWIVEFRQVQP